MFIYNLKGNVSELCLDGNVVLGGSWHDVEGVCATQDTVTEYGTNAWTGFRTVSRWKEWKPE
jgi:hypothetical protein